LHEDGLEPLSAAAQPRAAAFAGAFVVAWTEASPRQQMGRRFEARHVDADFGNQGVGRDLTHAGHGAYESRCLAKGFEASAHLLFDGGDRAIGRVDVSKVQFEHEAMVQVQNCAAALPHQVGEHDAKLEVGVFEHLFDTLHVRGAFAAGRRPRITRLFHGSRVARSAVEQLG